VAAFARYGHADVEELSTVIAVHSDGAALSHLLRVAAGAESVVMGEAQIQGQLKTSLTRALERCEAGPYLDRMFRAALEVGKRARTETSIASGHASIGSVAAALVTERLGSLEGRSVLVIGAGEMSALAARSLRSQGATSVFVANRNWRRAEKLADDCGGTAVSFEDLDEQLARADVVISSTSAPHYLLTPERAREAMTVRGLSPVVLVDLAVPRDIDPMVGAIPGCHLFDLDDLERAVAQTQSERAGELDQVERIVSEGCRSFEIWRDEREVAPTITRLRESAERIRAREYQRFERQLAHLSAEDRRRVEQLTRSIVNKLMHEPTLRLREAARSSERDDLHHATAAVENLFLAEASAER
jgi:glutamyl-tRNA reductase